MKYFIVADVHSFYDELQEALAIAGWDINNPSHILISLGDLLDRGKKPIECLEFINSIPKDRRILIRGNHEDLMEEMLNNDYPAMRDFHNGTAQTVIDCYQSQNNSSKDFDYQEAFKWFKNWKLWKTYINSCIDYYEQDSNVFVHGWIPVEFTYSDTSFTSTPIYIENWRNGDWNAARWYNGMRMFSSGIIIPDKTIYCGHWHTSWGHTYLHNEGCEFPEDSFEQKTFMHTEPFRDNGIVALDACTVISHTINCEVIDCD